MRKITLFIVTIFISQLGIAQDTIVKRNGDIVIAKVFEVGIDQIKYKRMDYEDGPTYIENKADLNFITYKNGHKEEFKNMAPRPVVNNTQIQSSSNDYFNPGTSNSYYKIQLDRNKYLLKGTSYNEKQIQNIMLATNNKKIMALIGSARDAQKFQYIGFGAIPLGLGAFYFFTNAIFAPSMQASKNYLTLTGICVAGTIACPILSGIYKHNRNKHNRAAIKLYNELY